MRSNSTHLHLYNIFCIFRAPRFLLWTTIVSALLCISACSDREPPSQNEILVQKIKVGYIPIADSAQLYVAKQNGLFLKHGLDVELVKAQGGAIILQGVITGDLEFGFTGTVPYVQARDRGFKVSPVVGGSVQTTSNPYQGIVTSSDGLEDVEGSRFAINVNKSLDHAFSVAYLTTVGREHANIEFIEMPFSQMEAQLLAGSVEYASMIEPFLSPALGNPELSLAAHHVADTKSSFQMTMYVANTDWLAKNQMLARKFVLAMEDSTVLIDENEEILQSAISEYTGMPAEKLETMNLPKFNAEVLQENLDWVKNLLIDIGFISQSQ